MFSVSSCKDVWIDTAVLSYKFGVDFCDGIRRDRWIPSWLIDFNIPLTSSGDKGKQDPCNPLIYYENRNNLIYQVRYDATGKKVEETFLKSALIQSKNIQSIDASKIINVCNLFKGNSVTDPIDNFKVESNGVFTLNPNLSFLPITITDDCKLKAVLIPSSVKTTTLNSLTGLGVSYDSTLDQTTVNLSKFLPTNGNILVQSTGTNNYNNKYIDFRYADTPTIDFYEDINGLRANVKISSQSSNSITYLADGLFSAIQTNFGPNQIIGNTSTASNQLKISDSLLFFEANGKIAQKTNVFYSRALGEGAISTPITSVPDTVNPVFAASSKMIAISNSTTSLAEIEISVTRGNFNANQRLQIDWLLFRTTSNNPNDPARVKIFYKNSTFQNKYTGIDGSPSGGSGNSMEEFTFFDNSFPANGNYYYHLFFLPNLTSGFQFFPYETMFNVKVLPAIIT